MRPAGKYTRTDPQAPSAYGICDLCGLRFNHRDLRWNYEWAGTHIYNTHSLRCWRCADVPFELNRTILLPPDPPPIINARTENFAYEEQTIRITQRGGAPLTQFAKPASQPPWNAGPQRIRCLEGANANIPRIIQLNTSS